MFKKILIFLLSTMYFVLCTNSVLAESEFIVDSKVSYDVSESGKTLVTHEITLENLFSTLYATGYSLTLENIEVGNVLAHTDSGQSIPTTIENKENQTVIKLNFEGAVVGKGKQRHFFVSYENTSFAIRTGEVWEISIPKLSNDTVFRNYSASLSVPLSFGFEAYVSPSPVRAGEQEGRRVYEFNKEELTKTGVVAGFGEFQVFSFTLNYHLENPLSRSAQTEIAVPPDTAYQRVFLRSMSPEPLEIKIDQDGNWLAKYNLKARERIDVTVSGEVQIFSGERPFPKPTEEILATNLSDTSYWQVNDTVIKKLADDLKTPRALYDYVSTTLKYDYERVKPNIERLGASNVLKNPNSAICMEFTDLFIALARSAGIPAREINGYAYTENPEIQPLSLVADVLHSWPEYWDFDRGVWIPVDPTWASTTGGVNFFDKLDLRHFAFVIHGADPQKPYPPGSYKLGSNPQKDVFVSFGKLSKDSQNFPKIGAELKQTLPFLNSRLNIRVKNSGQTALYSKELAVFFDQEVYFKNTLEVLTPYSTFETSIEVPYSFLGRNTPQEIKIEVGGSELFVPVNKKHVIVTSLIFLFVLFIIILVYILWKNHKLDFLKLRVFIPFGKAEPPSMSEKL